MTDTETTPYLGCFRTGDTFILTPAPNGGWVVSREANKTGHVAALERALLPLDTPDGDEADDND